MENSSLLFRRSVNLRFIQCFTFLFLWMVSVYAQAQPSSLTKFPKTSSNIKGYIQYLPPNYDPSGATKYPVLYWLHGLGETGGGTSATLETLMNTQIANWLKTNDVPFIVLIPQDHSGYWDDGNIGIKPFVDWANNVQYANVIDPNQQHMAGLSSGGYGIRSFIIGNTATYKAFATFTVMSSNLNLANNRASQIIANNQYVWIHHNVSDVSPNELSTVIPFHNAVYALDATRSRLTAYIPGGHDSWNKVYNSTGPSVQQRTGTVSGTTYYNWVSGTWYQWLLDHGKAVTPTPPVVNAGSDVSITLPTNTATLTGSATTSSGTTISSYLWSKVSGPAATLGNATTPTLSLSGLVEGTYVFGFTVTNSANLTAYDDVTVTVISVPTPPVVRTGVLVSQSAGSVKLMGSVTDDGTVTYQWAKVSGPAVTLQNATSAVVTVSGFTAGVYVFQLTATDDDNLSVTSEVVLFVEASAARQAVNEVENTDALTMFRELTPGADVMIYTADQEKIYQGKWDSEKFQEVFSTGGFYIYHVITNGQRSTGKLYIAK